MSRSKPRSWRDVPNSVVALGFVALFMDVSSELVHSLLPLFLVDTLGASLVTVGVIEGVAEATAAITKMFSGVISDRIGKRKLPTIVGYGLSAITKPIFPLAGSIVAVFAARFLDRIGKGIRDSPRDALVADITPPEIRGAAFGLRQALDTIGGVAGPVLAMADRRGAFGRELSCGRLMGVLRTDRNIRNRRGICSRGSNRFCRRVGRSRLRPNPSTVSYRRAVLSCVLHAESRLKRAKRSGCYLVKSIGRAPQDWCSGSSV